MAVTCERSWVNDVPLSNIYAYITHDILVVKDAQTPFCVVNRKRDSVCVSHNMKYLNSVFLERTDAPTQKHSCEKDTHVSAAIGEIIFPVSSFKQQNGNFICN